MEENLIENGSYKFNGPLKELKHKLKNFRTINVISNAVYEEVTIYYAECTFDYNGKTYKVKIHKDMLDHNIVYLEMLGEKHNGNC